VHSPDNARALIIAHLTPGAADATAMRRPTFDWLRTWVWWRFLRTPSRVC